MKFEFEIDAFENDKRALEEEIDQLTVEVYGINSAEHVITAEGRRVHPVERVMQLNDKIKALLSEVEEVERNQQTLTNYIELVIRDEIILYRNQWSSKAKQRVARLYDALHKKESDGSVAVHDFPRRVKDKNRLFAAVYQQVSKTVREHVRQQFDAHMKALVEEGAGAEKAKEHLE